MRPCALLGLLVACSTPAGPDPGQDVDIVVEPGGRIGDALAQSRALRAGGTTGTIYITLAPAVFADEELPLVLDVARLTLRGPRAVISAAATRGPDQAVLAVIADDVHLVGLTVYATAADSGIYVDRAHRFSIQGVEIAGAQFGIFARLADGVIADCVLRDNNIGSAIAAGNAAIGYDAVVRYEDNLVADNCTGGAFFASTPRYDRPPPLGADGAPILDEPPRGPGTLSVDMQHNVIAMNKTTCEAAGVQFFLHVGDVVDEEGVIEATVHFNDIVDNGGHELAVDAHHANLSEGPCPVTAPARFHGDFLGNRFGDPGKVFLGFAFRYPDGTCTVHDSTIDVTYADGEMDGFEYDNPAGFGNTLIVNGVAL